MIYNFTSYTRRLNRLNRVYFDEQKKSGWGSKLLKGLGIGVGLAAIAGSLFVAHNSIKKAEKLDKDLQDTLAELTDTQDKLTSTQTSLTDTQNSLTDTQNSLTDTQNKLDKAQTIVEDLTKENEKTKSELADQKKKIEELENLNKDMNSKLTEINELADTEDYPKLCAYLINLNTKANEDTVALEKHLNDLYDMLPSLKEITEKDYFELGRGRERDINRNLNECSKPIHEYIIALSSKNDSIENCLNTVRTSLKETINKRIPWISDQIRYKESSGRIDAECKQILHDLDNYYKNLQKIGLLTNSDLSEINIYLNKARELDMMDDYTRW